MRGLKFLANTALDYLYSSIRLMQTINTVIHLILMQLIMFYLAFYWYFMLIAYYIWAFIFVIRILSFDYLNKCNINGLEKWENN